MTGLIYVAIIAVWAVVLVPTWLRRHDHLDSNRSVDRFSRSLQALAQRESLLGIPLPATTDSEARPPAAQPDAAPHTESGTGSSDVGPEVFRVSREAAPAPGRRKSKTVSEPRPRASSAPAPAAARRRIVLGVLGVGLLAVAGLVIRGLLQPIALIVPAALILVFIVAARHQVRVARRRRPVRTQRVPASQPRPTAAQRRPDGGQPGGTWEARPATLPTYVTAPPAAEFPRVIDTATPGAWTAAAMLERAQQQKARAERMAAAKAEAIARAKAEQAAAEARSRDEEFLAQQTAAWGAADTTAPLYRRRAVNE